MTARRRLAGSTDVVDRDLQRVEHDLGALERRYPATRSKAVKWFLTRLAPGRHSPA
ncbi:hypothetical protein SAMN04489730_7779 [Amycolatopsis australiensis]|uniref:Uncharacterized protein n=1 Tax=Amycolatopsis australiensis TaxID=546364 RepID=A0A1K1T4K5_9PSEU|nr:hypothetical protein SAMN04489730_7779 [Amycolatopsis australiensis]